MHMLELVRCEDDRAKLGEELVNPNVESLLLDPEIRLGFYKNPGNGKVDLLAWDSFLVSFPIGKPCGLV